MRLIDVEKLLDAVQGAIDVMEDHGMNTVSATSLKAIIKCAPTINAIPVEWFKNRRDIYLKAYHAGHESELHVAAILNDTLKAWQKEQGAR